MEISHLHKYSNPLLSTLSKHLQQRLQPRISWGMLGKLGTTVFEKFLPFFSADPLELGQVG
jgi:hypothetical protein